MNDHTPRRLRGSLLERAAGRFDYAGMPPLPPLHPAARATPDVRAVEPVALAEPVAAAVAPEPAHVSPFLSDDAFAPPVPEPTLVPEFVPAAEVVAVAAPEAASDALELDAALLAPDIPQAGASAIDRALLREHGMIVPGAAITPLAEEFRMVKRQLLTTARAVAAKGTAEAGDRARMVLVCSARPNEGKTFCAINLALSMAAEKDMEILLVDADFAKPDVLERLGLASGPGLLDALSGAVADVESCILTTDVPQLSVLPAGALSNNDTELLASDRARAILDGLASANPRRIVIFDSPPALAASPASVLAFHVGQAMLVVRADETTESDLREAVNTLDACEHIQLVLNSVSFQPGGRRFGSYYGEAVE
ncbi:AAA family ATPase [Sphingomonas xinjiangensis]|uniref:Exopolysaccharide/PEP-CTERM locus tyrosine autokinase n=1 Tax=Sphingomonas xinjiangensis TaxID=643568 RepID=A0A840YN87_9SPHN|nr:AAA family ATPase [Sphingomonas xinjiangensis]MBB5708852.1 exopolysaccharide/PEP-CTERM locus tyrosine autokinase [Sphingomonas xinjiangensis]